MLPKSGQPVQVESWNLPLAGDDGSVRIRHDEWPGYKFVITLGPDAAVTGFALEREADAPALTARRLQRIPYGALERAALGLVAAWTAGYAEGRSPVVADNPYWQNLGSGVDQLARTFAATQYPGRRGRSPNEYAAVAARYVALIQTGSRSPVKDLADELGVSRARARNVIWECRERSLLTGPPKDRVAGGALTDKALGLLGRDPQQQES